MYFVTLPRNLRVRQMFLLFERRDIEISASFKLNVDVEIPAGRTTAGITSPHGNASILKTRIRRPVSCHAYPPFGVGDNDLKAERILASRSSTIDHIPNGMPRKKNGETPGTQESIAATHASRYDFRCPIRAAPMQITSKTMNWRPPTKARVGSSPPCSPRASITKNETRGIAPKTE